jgi:hypothetical protein
LIEIKEHDFPTCSSSLFQPNFKAGNLAAFLFARSASVPRDIRRDPPRLVSGEQLGRGSSPRLILEIDVGELLAGVVLHDEGGTNILD